MTKNYLALAFILVLGVSAKAQTFDFSFTLENTASQVSTVTGTIAVSGGKATEIEVNPFTYYGPGGTVTFTQPLVWTTNGGTGEGTLTSANTVTVSGGTITAEDVGGTSYAPPADPVSGATFSIGLDGSAATDFSGSYPYGTLFSGEKPTFTEAPEPSVLTLAMAGCGLAFLALRRRRFNI